MLIYHPIEQLININGLLNILFAKPAWIREYFHQNGGGGAPPGLRFAIYASLPPDARQAVDPAFHALGHIGHVGVGEELFRRTGEIREQAENMG